MHRSVSWAKNPEGQIARFLLGSSATQKCQLWDITLSLFILSLQNGLYPGYHFVDYGLWDHLDKLAVPCHKINGARLVAHHYPLCFCSRPHQRDCKSRESSLIATLSDGADPNQARAIEGFSRYD
jgi:hypothetical protein